MPSFGIFTWTHWLLLSVVLLAGTAQAQTPDLLFEHVSTREGLSHGFVNCMLQDKEGFMWFGTEDGLNRFDGYTFLSFTHDPTVKNSLSSNAIRCLYEDRKGNVWIGTDKGLNKLNKKNNTFSFYLQNAKNSATNTNKGAKIKHIYEDRQGTLWVGTYAGLNQFDPKTETFTLYEHDPGSINKWTYNYINTIYEDRRGNLWVGTTRGLSLFDRNTHTFTRFSYATDSKNKDQHLVSTILEDKAGTLWIATATDGLLEFDRQTHAFKVHTYDPQNPHSLSGNHVLTLFEDSFGTFWIGTQEGGLNRLDRKTGTFVRYPHSSTEPHSISANSISCIYEDRSKVLWIGNQENGLNKLDLLKKKITHFAHNSQKNNHIYNNFVSAVHEDHSGIVWIGGNLGLDRLDRKSGKFKHYTYPTADKVIGSNATNCIYEDGATIWIGMHGGGLHKFNPNKGTITSFHPDPATPRSLPHSLVNTLLRDQVGNLWIGTRTGLAKLDETSNQFDSYQPAGGINVLSIVEQAKNKLWLTTANHGIFLFDAVTNQFTSLLSQDSTFRQFCKEGLIFQFQDASNTYWLGLKSGGLVRLHPKNLHYEFIQEPKALTKVVLMAMQEDEQGNLWMATSKNGVYRFNPTTKALTNYDERDGLQSNQFLSASCKSHSGELYFGGMNGLNVFDPEQIRPNPYAPPVAISGFKVLDKPYPFYKEVTLPYKDNFFSFDFVALNYALPEKNQYAYQLEGFDPDWIEAGTRRYASYTNLDPGTYVFRVKAANHDGVWNRQGVSLRVTITPPWWRTHLAYLSYGLLIIAAGYGLKRYIHYQERLRSNLRIKSLESEKLQELDQLKSRFFTSVSHEFRTPLTLILSPLEKKLSRMNQDHPEAAETKLMHRNAHRLLELINQLLDISKLEAGKMRQQVESGDVIAQLKVNVFGFLSLAESKGIRLTFSSQGEKLPALFDKDKLEKIITNLLSNAIKFTPAPGTVEVNVRVEGPEDHSIRTLVIEVKDSGIGIPLERQERIFDRFYQVDNSHTRQFAGTGIGLALTKELVELLKGRIQVSSEVGVGSLFILHLPLQVINSASLESASPPVIPSVAQPAEWDTSDIQLQAQPLEQAPLLLLVEDNADLRHYILSTFQSDYRVLEAVDGEQGLALALETIPDLIISDWMMPKMDGRQLCQILKNDARTSHIPLILLTAKTTVENKIEGLQTGADDYLTKPFHAGELSVRARNLIEQRKRLRQRFSKQFIQPSDLAPEKDTGPGESESHIPKLVNVQTLVANPLDAKFLQRLDGIIEANLTDPKLSIDTLEREIGMSHAHFNRKLKAMTDQSPSEYLRNFRLRRAAQLLTQKQRNVSEVAYEVGFTHLSYFTRAFRQVYGVTPSQYVLQTHTQKAG